MRQRGNVKLNNIIAHGSDDWYDTILYTANFKIYNPNSYKKSWKSTVKSILLSVYSYTLLFTWLFRWKTPENFLISNAYVDLSLLTGKKVFFPPWLVSLNKNRLTSFKLFRVVLKIQKRIQDSTIEELLSDQFTNLSSLYKKELCSFMIRRKIRALIVPNDLSFFENISIKSCREIGIPTFVYLHGLPARYNSIDDNRADYLIVWGNGIRDLYVKAGVRKDKIFTIEHPNYSNFKKRELKSSLDDVLVLTKAVSLTPSCSNILIHPDTRISVQYLENLKSILRQLGIKYARLRLHPSESQSIYSEIDKDFFLFDDLPLHKSLERASLVVGPSSTVLLDAIISGVNYILYEPTVNGNILTFDGLELVGPFDGHSFISLSRTVEDFENNISRPFLNVDFNKLNNFFSCDEKDFSRLKSLL